MNSLSAPLRVILVVSLALNLFAAGAFAASTFKHGHSGFMRGHGMHRWHPARGMDPKALRRVLPEQDQPLLDQSLPAHREEIRKRVAAVHDARNGVAEALRAQPFDPQQLEAAFLLLREREGAVAEAAQDTLAELAARISPEGREKMAEQMLKRRLHLGPRPDDRQRPPENSDRSPPN